MATETRNRLPLIELGAAELATRLEGGALRAEEVSGAFLSQIAGREPEVQAWAHLDSDDVMAQAGRADAQRRTGRPTGPLHGLPVGIKDIIDVAGMPCENGTELDKGRVPSKDAGLVARLRSAGAIIMGKTVTTELAFLHPARTTNPAAPGHTPGGSSAGSAAAVACGMVPFAVGTQTGGSVIRPAAFCGCVGFKPSYGAIGRSGILAQSPFLDTPGVFARSVGDAAMLAEVLYGHDPDDRTTAHGPAPRLVQVASSKPPVTPTLAMLSTLPGREPDPQMSEAFASLTEMLGDLAFEIALPGMFAEAARIRARINHAEMAKSFYAYEKRGAEHFSDELAAAMRQGREMLARDYLSALDWRAVLNGGLDEIFERCDAIVMPATPGPAPEGFGSTGDAIYNGLWTLCGTPAVTLPLFETETGLPLGIQLVGRRGDDARLLRTARWLMEDFVTRQQEGS
ncbi:amidase [Profundibacterium mesophilum]|uniref:Aspartyl-tRNAglutamyl-tRNA amidotransferase subunit A n=1 Tax=Profundibacterium mesophilum KAUST100406-0324 TaxID=1037889 RepID=A0A921TEJ3_9RHOB|nr:amidase [Profundibacterium mesophilum]KAF0677367.1 aspartyl-tRNAglutamyl-tRNA amidotransferase subunit A [Profundibacterium mesophilum KAUST100406-0324]